MIGNAVIHRNWPWCRPGPGSHNQGRECRRQSYPPTGEPRPEEFPGGGQPAGQGAGLESKLARRFFSSPAFKATKDEGIPIPWRQSRNFFIEDRLEFPQCDGGVRWFGNPWTSPPLVLLSALGHPPGIQRRATSNTVQPTCQRFGVTDGSGSAGQDQERNLVGIVSIGTGTKDRLADTLDQRPMPAHQGRKGVLIPSRDKSNEQLTIRG